MEENIDFRTDAEPCDKNCDACRVGDLCELSPHYTGRRMVVVRSTGCPAMDALNLADVIRKGAVTEREAIATLEHIAKMVGEGHRCGEFGGDTAITEELFSVGGTMQ